RDGLACILGNVGKGSIPVVVIKNPGLGIVAPQVKLVNLGVDVSVDDDQVRPTIVIEVKEHGPPTQVLGMQSQAGGKGRVRKRPVTVIVVQGGSVVREVCLENVQPSVAVVVGNCRAHSSLLAAVLIEGCAGGHSHVRESAVAIIVIENAGRAVAGDVNVRPAIVVVVESGN